MEESDPLIPRSRDSANRPTAGLLSMLFIEFLQGIAYYTFLPFMVTFCIDELHFDNDKAVIWYLAFLGVLYMLPTISGALGDTVIGRFSCLLISITLFFIGTILLLSLAVVIWTDTDFSVKNKTILFAFSLLFIGIGYGSMISTSYSFGADQIANRTSENLWSFFIWKHWCFCLGKFIGYVPIPILLQAVGQENSLLPKALVVTLSMGIATSTLLLFKCKYNMVLPIGKESFRRLRLGFARCFPCFCKEEFDYDSIGDTEEAERKRLERQYNGYLFKKVVLLSALFSAFGFHEAIYNQLSSTYVLQAKHLKDVSHLPSVTMSMFGPAVVLICVPLLEVYNRRRGHWKTLDNVDIALSGAMFIIFSPLCAAILETFIKSALHGTPGKEITDISIWAQTPQYILTGFSDICCFIPATEFAYKESPRHIEGFISGMLFSAASFLALIIFIIESVLFQKFIPENNSVTTFELHFYIIMGTTVFIVICILLPFACIYRRFIEEKFQPFEKQVLEQQLGTISTNNIQGESLT